MANIAFGKLPLESSWQRPELATDGVISGYTGTEGFAFTSRLPENYTIDFGKLVTIYEIRVLLWDNRGMDKAKRPNREYTFTLEHSLNGKRYTEITENARQIGAGWFCFSFPKLLTTQCVRLVALSNTKNKEFHIVEFEVHDSQAPRLAHPEVHQTVLLGASIDASDTIEMINDQIASRTATLEDIYSKVNTLDTAISKLETLKSSISFEEAAKKNGVSARLWGLSSILLAIILICTICFFLYYDDSNYTLTEKWNKSQFTASHTTYALLAMYIAKSLIVSLMSIILSWALKNYKAQRHNQTINLHKSMILSTAMSVITENKFNVANTEKILEEALKVMFAHQTSGFEKESEENKSSVVQQIVSKGFEA